MTEDFGEVSIAHTQVSAQGPEMILDVQVVQEVVHEAAVHQTNPATMGGMSLFNSYSESGFVL